MSKTDEARFRKWVSGVLGLMAGKADDQLDYLSRHGIGPDEIALQFDDMRNVVEAKVDAEAIDPRALEILRPIEAQLSRMDLAGPGIWDRSSVVDNPDWETLRRLAADCLLSMGETLE